MADLLRLAQQAGKAGKPKKGKENDAAGRQQAAVELLQNRLADEQKKKSANEDAIEQACRNDRLRSVMVG